MSPIMLSTHIAPMNKTAPGAKKRGIVKPKIFPTIDTSTLFSPLEFLQG